MKGTTAIHDYAIEQMNRLLTTLAFQVHQAANKPGAKEIHDLRVSIRRFSQGLLLFTDFFPKWEVKKIKRFLKRMMRLTSEIRNRDIAIDFLAQSKLQAHRRRLERSGHPISASSTIWCAAGARAIFRPSGAIACLYAPYEGEMASLAQHGQERKGSLADPS